MVRSESAIVRRWRVVVVDDRADGSILEKPFHRVFYSTWRRVNEYIPGYCTNEEAAPLKKWTETASAKRREQAVPMVDVCRSFTEAYQLLKSLGERGFPPDIVLLDVALNEGLKGETLPDDVRSLLDENELQEADSDLLFRGGEFLERYIGQLFSNCPPLVRRFSYHSGNRRGQGVLSKAALENEAAAQTEVEKMYVQRLVSMLGSGEVTLPLIELCIERLQSACSCEGAIDKSVLSEVLPLQVSDTGWRFGSLFPLESAALVQGPGKDGALKRLLACVDQADLSLALWRLFEKSPLRILAHPSGRVPPWTANGNNAIRAATVDELFREDVGPFAAEAISSAMVVAGPVIDQHRALEGIRPACQAAAGALNPPNPFARTTVCTAVQFARDAVRISLASALTQLRTSAPGVVQDSISDTRGYLFLPGAASGGPIATLLESLGDGVRTTFQRDGERLLIRIDANPIRPPLKAPPRQGNNFPMALVDSRGWLRVHYLGDGYELDLHSGRREEVAASSGAHAFRLSARLYSAEQA